MKLVPVRSPSEWPPLLTMVLCLAWAGAAQAQYDGAANVPDQFADAFESISEADSQALLQVLAGDTFAGRGTGQEGYLQAARWFADQLQACGFQPAGPDGSWFQNVPFVRVGVVPELSGLSMDGSQLVDGRMLGISQYVGQLQRELPVTFAAVTDKRPQVAAGAFSGQLLIVRSNGTVRPEDPLLQQGQPACVLIVTEAPRMRTESVSRLEETPVPLPMAQIQREAAVRLATACGVDAAIFSGDPPESSLIVSSSRTVSCRLSVEREALDVPNVVAWYPGADPAVQHEHVAIGAHLDHLGRQQDKVYPGADDNGSGSTAVLQIARAMQASATRPRRSVLVMAFCAEERGLLGSKYYCEHPVRPLQDMVCMLNIDMIGRNEETADEPAEQNHNTIHLVGSRQISEQLHEMVLDANRYVNFTFEYDEERVNQRSDHASFAAKGVPVAFLFGGFNPHYHKTTDTLDGINFNKIANAARLNFLMLMLAAEHGHFQRNPAESSVPAR